MKDQVLAVWLKRAEVVGRAQERYLWLLLISGIFFLALDPAPPGSVEPLVIPILNLPLRPDAVWAAGPFILGFLVVAVMGSLYAFNTVNDTLKGAGMGEAIDTAPNALDFAFYTTEAKSPLWQRRVFQFVYPAYFALFVIQSGSLLVEQVRPVFTSPQYPVLWGLGLIFFLWASTRLGRYWYNNFANARALSKKPPNGVGEAANQ